MSNQISTMLTIVILMIAAILTSALTASIVLVFTISKLTHNNNNGNQSITISLAVLCDCGRPAISL
jgi:hypothetical protein